MQYMSPSPPPEPGASQQGPAGGGDERYDEEEEEEDISPDLWQEACWIVIRSPPTYKHFQNENQNHIVHAHLFSTPSLCCSLSFS